MIEALQLGMPHLTYNGLDPVWLSKHLGHQHWTMLHNVPAMSSTNERLYASFFCCYLDFGLGQDQYLENDIVTVESQLFKYSAQVYRSAHSLSNVSNTTTAIFDSIFVRKDIGNKQLVREDPCGIQTDIPVTESTFIDQHKQVKQTLRKLDLGNMELIELQFSPEAYFNAVKILYFANYLNLVFQSEYAHYPCIKNPIKRITSFYFGNIEPGDRVFGATTQQDSTYTTYLVANNRIIMACTIDR